MKLFYQLGYKYFRMPWDIGPRKELAQLVESGHITPCRAIDLGCGTGSNAIFLAQHGFDVTGIDYAASAIEKARLKADASKVNVEFIIDDLTNLQKVKGPFDFLVDYGTLDDLSPQDRDLYISNILSLTHNSSQFLLWCFEWRHRWWEHIIIRLLPFGALALEPGEADRRFSEYFKIERIAGEARLRGWPRGFAVYLMMRKAA
jgi:cyclopropane fatty-acyl-phospholipid synthase-like methyltransferase